MVFLMSIDSSRVLKKLSVTIYSVNIDQNRVALYYLSKFFKKVKLYFCTLKLDLLTQCFPFCVLK